MRATRFIRLIFLSTSMASCDYRTPAQKAADDKAAASRAVEDARIEQTKLERRQKTIDDCQAVMHRLQENGLILRIDDDRKIVRVDLMKWMALDVDQKTKAVKEFAYALSDAHDEDPFVNVTSIANDNVIANFKQSAGARIGF